MFLSLAVPATAQQASEPPRGSATRAALMDAVRVPAARDLGAPVEFVVRRLMVAGDVAMASLEAQRPGGGQIDMAQTPIGRAWGNDPEAYAGVIAFLQRRGGEWQVMHYAVSATDVWWFQVPEICNVFAPVAPPGTC